VLVDGCVGASESDAGGRRRGIGSGQARLIPIFVLGTLARKKHLVLNAPCRRLLGTPHSEKPCCLNERLGLF
jgi:hypothetical protein